MKLTKNKKGFSFLEVMISITVFSIGILAVLALVVSSMRGSMNSRNSIIASELAQEGIELTRNIRDNNLINGNPVFSANFFSGDSDDCRIDESSTVFDCGATVADKKLYIKNNFYVHDSTGSETKFQRKMMIKYDTTLASTAAKADLYSIVIWGNNWPLPDSDNDKYCNSCNVVGKCICVKDILTKWR